MEHKTQQADDKKAGSTNDYPIVGKSKAVEQLIKQIGRLAKTRKDVVVIGEAGVGKGAIAKNIYFQSKTGLNEKDFAIGLLQTEKVAIVPGSAFGENGKGFCRACFATSYEQLIEASNRIERHVQALTKKS